MDVKTLYALTKRLGSLRCHGCEDFVRTAQAVGSLRNHGCEDCVSTDPGGGIIGSPGGEILEISWM